MISLEQVRLSRIGPRRIRAPPTEARNRKKQPLKLFPIILDPALNQKVHLIQILLQKNLHTKKEKGLNSYFYLIDVLKIHDCVEKYY